MTRLRGRSDADYLRPEGVDERAVMTVFRVPPEVAGQRVDVFIQSQLHRTSRTRAQFIVRASAYDAAGRALRPNDRVRAGMEILLWRAPWDETPVPTDVPVLYEDEHLLAVDKPAHLPVHPTARYHRNTLIKILQSERPGQFLSLGHRIDRETSGVLLVSKSSACDRALKRALELRDGIEKTYFAITRGIPALAERGRVRFERNMELDSESPLRVKMRISDAPDSLYASTVFEILEVRGEDGAPYALVRCDLETGRQHQIRVHLATLGAPLVGDKLYGHDERAFARAADGELTEEDHALLEMPRHALHAAALALPHPMTGEPLRVESPLPEDMAAFWDALTSRAGSSRDRLDRAPRE
jgi:23S rRNA pseudouridine1911/1915/1917 synthase